MVAVAALALAGVHQLSPRRRAHSIAAGMLALGVVMTLEERERAGERLRRSLGVALLAAAVLTLVWAV